jgi:hypothetical protein
MLKDISGGVGVRSLPVACVAGSMIHQLMLAAILMGSPETPIYKFDRNKPAMI